MQKTQTLSAEDFLTQLRLTGLPSVVVVQTRWNAPNRDMRPTLERLAREFAGRAGFCAVDAVEHARLAGELRAWSLPAVLFVKGGREVRRVEGWLPFERLEAMVSSFAAAERAQG